jgi:hypothetical protein
MTHSANDFGTQQPAREETDDDLDLLTYNEARVRLAEEVAAEESHHAELSSRRPGPDPTDAVRVAEELAASQRRIDALRSTLERTSTRAVSPANAAEFYGYGLVTYANDSDPPYAL